MFSTDYIQKTRRIMNRLHKNQRRNTITREEKEKKDCRNNKNRTKTQEEEKNECRKKRREEQKPLADLLESPDAFFRAFASSSSTLTFPLLFKYSEPKKQMSQSKRKGNKRVGST